MKIHSSIHQGPASTVVAGAVGALRGFKPRLVVAMASTKQPLAEVLAGLSDALPDAVVVGCSTAGEFTGDGDKKGSTSVFAVAGDDIEVSAAFAPELSKDAEAAVALVTGAIHAPRATLPFRTAIMFLDALAGVSEETTLLLSEALGSDVPLAGGAAGDDLAMKAPLVGLSTRAATQVASNAIAVVVLHTRRPLGIGVQHGHRTLSSAIRVTKSSGAVVHTLDDKPAWDVWREHTREAAHARGIDVDTLTDETVGSFLLQFEAGLGGGAQQKIRAPLSRQADGSLGFACGIPEGSVIHITEGFAQPQIDSAEQAARDARKAVGGDVAGALVFDCICRNLILGARFAEAVERMSAALDGAPLAGFESYGEVALCAGDFSGFHNTTSVVLAFPK